MADKKKESLPAKVKWLQRFFSVAGNVAPHTAIEIMVKFIFTPKKRVLRPPHTNLIMRADKRIFEVSDFRNKGKKIKMKYYVWGSGSKTVFLIHGWDGMALDYYKMIPTLVKDDYRVISIDGPAHGGSEGDTSNLLHFKEAMAALIKKTGTPYAIIGHSMGGAASTYLLMEENIIVNRLIQIAIPISSKKFFDLVFDMLNVPQKMQQVFFNEMEREFRIPVEQMDLTIRKEKIKADKILLVYDEDDEEIPVEDIHLYLTLHPEIQSFNAKGAGHNKIIRSAKVIDEVRKFLQ